MKKLLSLIVLTGLAVGGYYGWNKWTSSKSTSDTPLRPTTAAAELRNIGFAVNAAGEITPADQVSVRAEIDGKIDTLPVDIGDKVKKSDLLFKLDDKELQQQRASNLTDVEKGKLDLQKAERDLKRAERLLGDRLISQELYDDTKTAYDLAKVALERTQKNLAIIDERLTKTEVRAPFDCTILTRPVSIGQAISGSGGFSGGTEVLTIANLGSMIINAQVNQADVPRLKADQKVEVTVEAVPGLTISGVVERVSPQATIKNNIKGYAARVALKNVDPRVRPGMTANVKIPVATADNVTAVPLSAIFTEKNPETELMERFVYVQQSGGGAERRLVKVGISDFFFAEIQDGLSAGEVVMLEMPKEEQERKAKLAGKGGSDNGAPASSKGGSGKKLLSLANPATNSEASALQPGMRGTGGARN
jgi:RND family efflux transporter MFP subunit